MELEPLFILLHSSFSTLLVPLPRHDLMRTCSGGVRFARHPRLPSLGRCRGGGSTHFSWRNAFLVSAPPRLRVKLLFLHRRRQSHFEHRAALAVRGADGAAVSVDDRLGDGQAEAGVAAVLSRSGGAV